MPSAPPPPHAAPQRPVGDETRLLQKQQQRPNSLSDDDEEDDGPEAPRPWHAVHHWADPGPPVPGGSHQSGIERQLELQVAACVAHNPGFLREVQREMAAAAASSASPTADEGGRAAWAFPSVEVLTKKLSAPSSSSASSLSSQAMLSKVLKLGHPLNHLRGGEGDSYDPSADESYSDEVASALDEALLSWQRAAERTKRRLGKRAPRARLLVKPGCGGGHAACSGRNAARPGGGGAPPASPLPGWRGIPASWLGPATAAGARMPVANRATGVAAPAKEARRAAGAVKQVAAPAEAVQPSGGLRWRLPWLVEGEQ